MKRFLIFLTAHTIYSIHLTVLLYVSLIIINIALIFLDTLLLSKQGSIRQCFSVDIAVYVANALVSNLSGQLDHYNAFSRSLKEAKMVTC